MEYKSTLNLPKTDFPMKADLPKREPLFLKRWQDEKIYDQIMERRKTSKPFILHDGPPFANGDIHMGHALNMALKDIVLKFKNMTGHYVPFIPGWDCHGLPIEHKVMKEMGATATDPLSIRAQCDAYARKYVDVQREQFKRMGVFGDWENPYLTIDPKYEAEILRVFATIVEKGWVYQALRPVYWSTGCQTALAEAEIEYMPKTDLSVYVRFPLTRESAAKLGCPETTALLIWTTTPWTLPANLAIAVAPHLTYGLYKSEGHTVICATALAPKIPHLAGVEAEKTWPGTALEGLVYQHPFLERTSGVFPADFVTADSGTGLVHSAPGHGHDDYVMGQRAGLGVLSPVDDRGCLTSECGVPSLVGQYVFKANPLVRDLLKSIGVLWAEEEFVHDYPHCWRSKTPIVFRAVKQWFIRIDAFRAEALDAIEKVEWVPSWGKNRIRGALETRPDWCISRQRTWGVPIPVFYGENGQAHMTAETVRKFADLVEKKGTNAWFSTPDVAMAEKLGLPKDLRKGNDTLDVWIDSGSSHTAVVRKRLTFPADMYLEGSDQHRGWFQSSLLTSVAVNGVPPYRQVLTNGFVVDLDGKKLSKSNTYQKPTALMDFVNVYGADILRLWVASQDYRDDVPFSEEIFKRVTDMYRSVRNTLRILLANLSGFQVKSDAVPMEQWTEIDLYIYCQLQELARTVHAAYNQYEFHQVYHAINRFCAVDLSSLYIDVLKDRMYCDGTTNSKRRASQTVMHACVDYLTRLMAPLVPFTSEEAWLALGNTESVHLQLLPEPQSCAKPGMMERWQKLLALRVTVNEKLEAARQKKEIGKSLEARVELISPDFKPEDAALLEELFIVSQVSVSAGASAEVRVLPARGKKCGRCWKFTEDVGHHVEHPEICGRCHSVVTAKP